MRSFIHLWSVLVALLGVVASAPVAAQINPTPAWLRAATGDGSASFPVGPFGELPGTGFGYGYVNGVVTWNPLGPEPERDSAYNTFLVVSDRHLNPASPTGYALVQPDGWTYRSLGRENPASVGLINVSTTASTRETHFRLPNLGLAIRVRSEASAARLVQTYTFTDTTGAPAPRTFTVARFSDIDIQFPTATSNYAFNLGHYQPQQNPYQVRVSDPSGCFEGVMSLDRGVDIQGARVYMRLNNNGGGGHERAAVSYNLGHFIERLIFEGCSHGATINYGDCGVLTDPDGDGVSNSTGDHGVTLQGVMTVPPAPGSAEVVTSLAFVNSCRCVQDATLSVSQSCLMPPSHDLRDITLSLALPEGCDLARAASMAVHVESNEPDDALGGGDGATTGDIEILGASGAVAASSAGSVGTAKATYTFGAGFWSTGQMGLRLRAERQGAGNGRVYMVTVRVHDRAGQEISSHTQTIRVPHDRNRSGEGC